MSKRPRTTTIELDQITYSQLEPPRYQFHLEGTILNSARLRRISKLGERTMQEARYIRLYNDELGESHFDDLVVELPPVDFAPPAPPLRFMRMFPAKDCGFLGVPVKWGGEVPHPSPRRQLFCILAGEFEVGASDGTYRALQPGSVLLLEDISGKGHTTRVLGPGEGFIVTISLQDG